MTAIFLEGGIVFHSVFVGINYGILQDDGTSVALLIALVFHQVRPLPCPAGFAAAAATGGMAMQGLHHCTRRLLPG